MEPGAERSRPRAAEGPLSGYRSGLRLLWASGAAGSPFGGPVLGSGGWEMGGGLNGTER